MIFPITARFLKVLRTEIGKDDLPIQWAEFFLLVCAAGNRGVTTKEVCDEINFAQAPASRMVKHMSQYLDPKTRTVKGYDIYTTFPDFEHRHRQRIVLSNKGKLIAEKLAALGQKGQL